jgi:hypothetical protein
MRILVLLAVLVGSVSVAYAQPTRLMYGASELKDDISLAKRVLTERHPDLYGFYPKDTIDARFSRLEVSLNDSIPASRAYEMVAEVFNNLGCGHTMLAPSSEFVKMNRKSKRLPFKFKYIDDKLLVMRSYLDDTTFALGWQIVSVDGNKVNELAQRFMKYYSTDGYNQTLKYRQMEAGFRDDYAWFIGSPDTMSIEFLTGAGETKTMKVPALPMDTINARYARRYSSGSPKQKLLRLNMVDSTNTAVLTIGSFHPKALIRSKQHFKRFVRRSFREINKQKADNLVIDLRNNPGGYSNYGIFLYSWLADSSFRYFEKMELPTKKPINFLRYTDKTPLFNALYLLVSHEKGTGKCCYRLDPGLRTHKPRKKAFKGNVYVLINGNSFSNSCNFSALAQYHKRAVFVGEETGGRYDGCNGSAYVMLTLPNTGMKLNVPLVKNTYPFPGYPYKGRGIMPDHPVQPAIEDAIKSIDREMIYTMELIQKKRHLSRK